MTVFTVTIDDAEALAGITWARETHNQHAEALAGEGGSPPAEMPILSTDQEYVQWVMQSASNSYAQQKAASPPTP